MRHFTKLLVTLIALPLTVGIVSCSNPSSSDAPLVIDNSNNSKAGSISYATTTVSKTTDDTAFTNELSKTGDGTVTYASSKTGVATVNETTGEVTIVSAGETVITATVADSDTYTYATKTASYTLTVTAADTTQQKSAGSISYATASVSKTTDSTAFTNELTIEGNGTVTYSSSDETVATVNASTGEVTIVGAGTATITATVTDSASYTYATKTASYTVKVLSETLLTTITATGAKNGSATSENISYSTGGVATLTFSGEVLYASVWGWWGNNITLTVTPADGYTITKCVFYDNKDNNATDSEAPFVAETSGDQKMPKVNGSYIYPYSDSAAVKKIEVYGYDMR